MLTPAFYQGFSSLPSTTWWPFFAHSFRGWMKAVGFRVVVEGVEHLPRTPALLATNSTQTYDFLAFMKGLDQAGHRVVSVTKAKNFHNPWMSFVMRRAGVVPVASRGYFIVHDFMSVVGRRPSEEEYRVLRRHLDAEEPLPEQEPFLLLQRTPRQIVGHVFQPSMTTWRQRVQQIYQSSLQQTVRLARAGVQAGFHVQIYPEGTVSQRLGVGKPGAVQLAHALSIPVIPVGMSGCPEAFFRGTPIPADGTVRVRIGAPIDVALPAEHRSFLPEDEQQNRAALHETTERLMSAIDGLLEPPYRRSSLPLSSKGTRAFL